MIKYIERNQIAIDGYHIIQQRNRKVVHPLFGALLDTSPVTPFSSSQPLSPLLSHLRTKWRLFIENGETDGRREVSTKQSLPSLLLAGTIIAR